MTFAIVARKQGLTIDARRRLHSIGVLGAKLYNFLKDLFAVTGEAAYPQDKQM
jgi:hypothetical protein